MGKSGSIAKEVAEENVAINTRRLLYGEKMKKLEANFKKEERSVKQQNTGIFHRIAQKN